MKANVYLEGGNTLSLVPRGPSTTPGPLTHAVAEILADAFAESLWTQRAFGQKVGMSASSVSRTLVGERTLDLEQFVLWCRHLRLDAVDVLNVALRHVRR